MNKLKVLYIGTVSFLSMQMWGNDVPIMEQVKTTQNQAPVDAFNPEEISARIQDIKNPTGQEILKIEIARIRGWRGSYNSVNERYIRERAVNAFSDFLVNVVKSGQNTVEEYLKNNSKDLNAQILIEAGVLKEVKTKVLKEVEAGVLKEVETVVLKEVEESYLVQEILNGKSSQVLLKEIIVKSDMSQVEKLNRLYEIGIMPQDADIKRIMGVILEEERFTRQS